MVINARFLKPLDSNLIAAVASMVPRIITIEENVLQGGFGSAVLEFLHKLEMPHVRIRRIGMPDIFVEQGEQDELRKKYGLDEEGIYQPCCPFSKSLPITFERKTGQNSRFKGTCKEQRAIRRLIMEGKVFVDGKKITKAGTPVSEEFRDNLEKYDLPYVSRGGLQTRSGIAFLYIDVENKIIMDVGSSNRRFYRLSSSERRPEGILYRRRIRTACLVFQKRSEGCPFRKDKYKVS